MQVVVVTSMPNANRIIESLSLFGIKAQQCDNLTDTSDFADAYGADLALVDVAFSGGGLAAVKALRVTHKTLPIVVFGSDIAREHVLSSLSAGADEMLRWPGDVEVIAARIRAIVRRCRGTEAAALQIGPLNFDMIRRSLQIDNASVILTKKEYSVLEYMVSYKGMILTKDALLNQLYGCADAPDSRIIDVFICKLRKKMADYGVQDLIETVRGLGYRLNEQTCRFVRTMQEVA